MGDYPESMSETSEITGPLIAALNQTGGYAIRMNSGKIRAGKRWIILHEAGTADILFFPRNIIPSAHRKPVWIETKQPKGHTNPEQVKAQADFKAKVEALGHRYIRVTSVKECLDLVLGT